jgi:hypothetical protein
VFRREYARITTRGFPHSEIPGSKFVQQLPGAYRSRPRPSSPSDAKASTACPSYLDDRAHLHATMQFSRYFPCQGQSPGRVVHRGLRSTPANRTLTRSLKTEQHAVRAIPLRTRTHDAFNSMSNRAGRIGRTRRRRSSRAQSPAPPRGSGELNDHTIRRSGVRSPCGAKHHSLERR